MPQMARHQIPNAFLIRALGRGTAEHCEGCGSRMFVKTLTGKCPYCRAGYPPRVVRREPESAHLPFAPRLGEPVALGGWLSWLVSEIVTWALRAVRRSPRPQRHAPLSLSGGQATQSVS
jgi:endogenous inhibitor of DNA gyrase (YacG/DUF329 family)